METRERIKHKEHVIIHIYCFLVLTMLVNIIGCDSGTLVAPSQDMEMAKVDPHCMIGVFQDNNLRNRLEHIRFNLMQRI